MDFRRATALFADPAFDGDPVQIYEPGPDDPPLPPDEPNDCGPESPTGVVEEPLGGFGTTDAPGTTPTKYYVNNVEVRVATERVQYLDVNGRLITESLRDYSRKTVRKAYSSLDKFLAVWNDAEKKQAILEELATQGMFLGKNSPSRSGATTIRSISSVTSLSTSFRSLGEERADRVRKRNVFGKYGEKARAVLDTLLQKYADSGITSVESLEILKVDPLTTHGTPVEIVKLFGGRVGYLAAIRDLEAALYQNAARLHAQRLQSGPRASVNHAQGRRNLRQATRSAFEQLGWMFFLKIFDDREKEMEIVRSDYRSCPTEAFALVGGADRRRRRLMAKLCSTSSTTLLLPKLCRPDAWR